MSTNNLKRSALSILGELDNGMVIAELTEAIHAAHSQAAATQRPAKVQLTLTIKPAVMKGTPGVNHGDVLQVIAAVDSKLPKPAHDATIFFVNADGNISRNQDRQGAFPGVREIGEGGTQPSPNPATA